MEGLQGKYGADVGKVATAAVMVAKENGSYEFLEQSRLLDHWMIVDRLIKTAEKKGYFAP